MSNKSVYLICVALMFVVLVASTPQTYFDLLPGFIFPLAILLMLSAVSKPWQRAGFVLVIGIALSWMSLQRADFMQSGQVITNTHFTKEGLRMGAHLLMFEAVVLSIVAAFMRPDFRFPFSELEITPERQRALLNIFWVAPSLVMWLTYGSVAMLNPLIFLLPMFCFGMMTTGLTNRARPIGLMLMLAAGIANLIWFMTHKPILGDEYKFILTVLGVGFIGLLLTIAVTRSPIQPPACEDIPDSTLPNPSQREVANPL